MADLALLRLDLRSPLAFAGTADLPFLEAGRDPAEGEEELFLFEEGELAPFDPDEGPILRRPLPRPAFHGRRPAAPGAAGATLPAGSYAFLQWRPRDEAELMEGLEWFAREVWWERLGATGPYAIRRLREDGRLATQALRRIAREPARGGT